MAVSETVTLQWTRTLINALLAALTARPAGALLTTPTVGLFVGDTVPTEDSVFANFTAPTFHGYTGQALTLVGPVNLAVNIQGMLGTVTFIATSGGTISDTATGYWISDGVSALYAAERFATPVPFAIVGDFLTLTVAFPLPTSQDVAA